MGNDSTLYVSMLPYEYTNNDVAQLFSSFGTLARVTILRDKKTRASRGVAFVQFARAEDCQVALAEMNGQDIEGFKIDCSICKDNGRSKEFSKRRTYDSKKNTCFECGEHGHQSYDCPRNALGKREKPKRHAKRKRKKYYYDSNDVQNTLHAEENDEEDDGRFAPIAPSLLHQESPRRHYIPHSSTSQSYFHHAPKVRKRQKSGYFSDEDASD